MYVSHDRRSDVTASTCSGSVVVGGWLLTMAAVAAFAFTSGDTLRDGHDAVLVSQTGASFDQSLTATRGAARRTSPRIAETDLDNTVAPRPGTPDSPAAPRGTCGAPATSGTVQRVSDRELTSRSTHVHSGASISRITASACRVGSSPKLNISGVSAPSPGRAAGASRPVRTEPAVR